MTQKTNVTSSRAVIYFAMAVLLATICIAAFWGAPPVYLAVCFIGEIILVATAHLSSMIEHYGFPRSSMGAPPSS
ncbi:MAG TPA: hypothetical protein VM243_01515 [Phycisphaerae bacterium]|nr:hypothetical protein [Phycisphaerae bacterium]